MPAVWFALRRSMHCNSESSEIHDPNGKRVENLRKISTKKHSCGQSGCSRSIANLKDVIISKRHSTEKLEPICSPRSIGSSELMNPITHEVVLNNSTCELKISAGSYGLQESDGVFNFVGVLKPGTPGPGRVHMGPGQRLGYLESPIRRTNSGISKRSSGFDGIGSRRRDYEFRGGLVCHKCGEQFVKWEAMEEHHLSKHAVTELVEGDSSRKIVEIICRGNCTNVPFDGIERILKVHNMQNTIAQFEEYRELVKIRANKLANKHPRCMADGNELLRFHGTTLKCSLGNKGCSSSLCKSNKCGICLILRHGFSTNKKEGNSTVGVFTASTSNRAFESVQIMSEDLTIKKALIVCRVIAGRVHRPLENIQELSGQLGFDSLAGKVGIHSNIEELYLLSHRALLPCFVVIYKN